MKNYVCRKTDGGFFLARGEPLQEDKSLAIVKSWSEPIVTPRWSITDIASGCFLVRADSKKKLLERWEFWKEIHIDYNETLNNVRSLERYKKMCEELEVEQHIWRESGYDI